ERDAAAGGGGGAGDESAASGLERAVVCGGGCGADPGVDRGEGAIACGLERGEVALAGGQRVEPHRVQVDDLLPDRRSVAPLGGAGERGAGARVIGGRGLEHAADEVVRGG